MFEIVYESKQGFLTKKQEIEALMARIDFKQT